MLINATFKGMVEKVVNKMLKKGIVNSKAEAIRVMAMEYYKNNQNILIENKEDKWEDDYVEYIDKKRAKTHKELIENKIVSEADFI
ncbi:MAG: hypothetical protein WC356_01080 [Candidatus Micrarchaeia archaeon]|jgi:hypothetical protein